MESQPPALLGVLILLPAPPASAQSRDDFACSADAETWRGLQVCNEQPRDGYDRDAFGTGYSNLEDDIIAGRCRPR